LKALYPAKGVGEYLYVPDILSIWECYG
jgi:hypothetical protein